MPKSGAVLYLCNAQSQVVEAYVFGNGTNKAVVNKLLVTKTLKRTAKDGEVQSFDFDKSVLKIEESSSLS